jgi:hypothetical protein
MVLESLLRLKWKERAQAHKGHQRALAGTPRMGCSHEGHQRKPWVPRRGDCDVPHRLRMGMCLYV